MSDKDLIERLQRGDTSALGVLYNRYKQTVLLYLYSLGGGDDAEDLLHETFIKAMRYPNTCNTESEIQGWFLGIAKQRIISRHIKRNAMKRKAVEISMNDESLEIDSGQRDPEQILESKMEVAKIHKNINTLPTQFQEAIQLRCDGYDYEGIADILNLPLGTVKSRIYRARALL